MSSSGPAAEQYVWDPFVRIAHWVLAAGFAVAYVTEDHLLPVHVWAGYGVGGLVVARVLWGFVGPRHARFSDFLYPPRVVLTYLSDLLHFRSARHLGHSPAGGAMVIALLVCLAATTATGLAVYGAQEGAGPLGSFYATAPGATGPTAERVETGGREAGRQPERRAGRQKARLLKETHELLANLTLVLVLLHIAGVVWASVAHRENLVRAMITGRKRPDMT